MLLIPEARDVVDQFPHAQMVIALPEDQMSFVSQQVRLCPDAPSLIAYVNPEAQRTTVLLADVEDFPGSVAIDETSEITMGEWWERVHGTKVSAELVLA